MTHNDAVRNNLVDTWGGYYDSGKLRFYSGSAPGSNNAATGTLLAEIDLPASPWTSASSCAISPQGTWQDPSANNTGTAGYARIISSDGTLLSDLTVSATGGGGELELNTLSIVATGVVTVTGGSVTKTNS